MHTITYFIILAFCICTSLVFSLHSQTGKILTLLFYNNTVHTITHFSIIIMFHASILQYLYFTCVLLSVSGLILCMNICSYDTHRLGFFFFFFLSVYNLCTPLRIILYLQALILFLPLYFYDVFVSVII